jgi:hypothetical protein
VAAAVEMAQDHVLGNDAEPTPKGITRPVVVEVLQMGSHRRASCSRDGTVRIWHIPSGTCQVLPGHTDEVFTAAFHSDGTRLATAGRDRAVSLWDLAKGEEVARLPGHTSYVWSLAFSPDGTTRVSGSGDGTVRLWDTEPLAKRYQARHEAESLRPEAERIVLRLFAECRKSTPIVTRLWANQRKVCGAAAATVVALAAPMSGLLKFGDRIAVPKMGGVLLLCR